MDALAEVFQMVTVTVVGLGLLAVLLAEVPGSPVEDERVSLLGLRNAPRPTGFPKPTTRRGVAIDLRKAA